MTIARMYLICGNCGCNDEFEFEYKENWSDNGDGTFESDVCISCKNCSTLHCLSDNAKNVDKSCK